MLLQKKNKLSTQNKDLEARVMLVTETAKPGLNTIENAITQARFQSLFDGSDPKVILEEGSYTITEPLVIASDLTLQGAGTGTVIEWDDSVADTINEPMITNENTATVNATLADFKLRGPYSEVLTQTNRTSMHGILIEGEGNAQNGTPFDNSNILIDNVEVRNFAAHGIHVKGTEDIELDGVYAHTNGNAYELDENGDKVTDLFHNVYFRRTNNAKVFNSKLNNSPSGHGLRVAETPRLDLKTTQIRSNQDHGVHMSNSSHINAREEMKSGDGDTYDVTKNVVQNWGIYSGSTRQYVA